MKATQNDPLHYERPLTLQKKNYVKKYCTFQCDVCYKTEDVPKFMTFQNSGTFYHWRCHNMFRAVRPYVDAQVLPFQQGFQMTYFLVL